MSAEQARPRRIVRIGGGPHVRGTYDAAQTTDNNARHWAATDSLSADEANSYSVRKKLRERARYEVANNTYAYGIIGTYACDVVGRHGPRLQMLTPHSELNQEIERQWLRWAARARFGAKLRTLHRARVTDGEAFALVITNERLGHPIKLDIRLLECDRFHSPDVLLADNNIDGVILDEVGNPLRYQVLAAHPGSSTYPGTYDLAQYDAEWVLHWFGQWRPEQHRGVPEITSALPLFAQLRRWTLATISAAETAANFSAILYTDAPPSGSQADEEFDAFDAVEIERNMMMTIPHQWKLAQLEAQQPSSTYRDAKREILNEIARPVAMPRNMAAGDSSDYNFASGRLDHGTYFKAVGVLQGDLGDKIDEHIFPRWLAEGRRYYGWPVELDADHEWLWQQREPIDPREARAETERLGSGAVTLPAIYASRGQDWRAELPKGAEALGVSLEQFQALIRKKLFGGPNGGVSSGGHSEDLDALLEDIAHGISA